jgi:hypothetical protein
MLLLISITVGFVLLGLLIYQTRKIIMTKIAEMAASVNAALAQANASLDGVRGDITGLKDQVDSLKLSLEKSDTSVLSAEDQAALDQVQASVNALADKAASLDALTPVEVPAEEPASDNGESLQS